jgi:hypothetical protein
MDIGVVAIPVERVAVTDSAPSLVVGPIAQVPDALPSRSDCLRGVGPMALGGAFCPAGVTY